jgi:hypothetical protein
MKRLTDGLLFIIFSALLIFEPVVYAKQEMKKDVVIEKENIQHFLLDYRKLCSTILNELEGKGIGLEPDSALQNIDRLITSARDVELSGSNIDYLLDFIRGAEKAISQYPPIDISQIDISSENLPGLFINQVLGLLAPFFTSAGGALSLVGAAIITFITVPLIPLMIVLALGVGIVGLLLGVLFGLPVALVYLAITFLSGLGGDNETSQQPASISFDYRAAQSLKQLEGIDNYNFMPPYKSTNQLLSAENVTSFIGAFSGLPSAIIDSLITVMQVITDNMSIITGFLGNIISTSLISLMDAIPIFSIFAIGGFLIFALIGVALSVVLLSPLILLLSPVILLFVALGLAIGGVGFLMFNRSLTPMSFDSVNMTFYDVINKSVASIKGDPLKHVDIIVRDILEFAKEAFGKDSYAYFDNLENSVLSVDLRTIDGIKKATDRILEFIPLIK